MKRRVYRSLDRPATVFGIRGRFMYVMFVGGALALVVGLVAGRASSMVLGFGAGILAAVAAYLLTLSLQSKVDEKDIFKMVARRSYPTLYLVRPKHIRNIWKGFNLAAGKAAEE
ncbi:MAG: hypothetical protein IKP53_04810 [Candidatus Methanomethylophilaceae archaeon]|nr:hypothetical protein [Candidatus Methanomethylophilaceae archaeon]